MRLSASSGAESTGLQQKGQPRIVLLTASKMSALDCFTRDQYVV